MLRSRGGRFDLHHPLLCCRFNSGARAGRSASPLGHRSRLRACLCLRQRRQGCCSLFRKRLALSHECSRRRNERSPLGHQLRRGGDERSFGTGDLCNSLRGRICRLVVSAPNDERGCWRAKRCLTPCTLVNALLSLDSKLRMRSICFSWRDENIAGSIHGLGQHFVTRIERGIQLVDVSRDKIHHCAQLRADRESTGGGRGGWRAASGAPRNSIDRSKRSRRCRGACGRRPLRLAQRELAGSRLLRRRHVQCGSQVQ